MNKEIAIEIKEISKYFRLPTESSNSIKQTFVNWTRGVKGYKEQKVLRNISFRVEKGDFFGIVGRNGSGKSTLLKLISGIYMPDEGSITINGSLVSFIELGVGFNSELTGRENVYLNGALMGFSTSEIDSMYDEIVKFAELEEFMDQKLKNYSSGMQVRLAFSCAIRAKSDILVLDEILAVGDEAFQHKCNDYFEQMRDDCDKTIILVTHSMSAIKEFCNRAIMIKDGAVVAQGSPDIVASAYSLENIKVEKKFKARSSKECPDDYGIKNLRIRLVSPEVINQNDEIKVTVEYEVTKSIDTNLDISMLDIDSNSYLLYDESQKALTRGPGKYLIEYSCDLAKVVNNRKIKVSVAVSNSDTEDKIAYSSSTGEAVVFVTNRTDLDTDRKKASTAGIIKMYGKWKKL